MSALPKSPRLISGGIVIMDPNTYGVESVIVLQYNPDSWTHSVDADDVSDKELSQEGRRGKSEIASPLT